MSSLSRALRRWHPVRVASAGLGLAVLLILGAYIVDVVASRATAGGAVSALCLLAFGGAELLYTWRLGAGAPVE